MRADKQREASALDTAQAVLAAFLGIRRRADHDAIRFNPVHLLAAGVVGAGALVVTLMVLVTFIVSRAG